MSFAEIMIDDILALKALSKFAADKFLKFIVLFFRDRK